MVRRTPRLVAGLIRTNWNLVHAQSEPDPVAYHACLQRLGRWVNNGSTDGSNPDVSITITEKTDGSLSFVVPQQAGIIGDLPIIASISEAPATKHF